MLRVPKEANVGYHNRGNGPQSRNDLSGIVEPTHMGVAGGETPIRQREAWIVLDREEQPRHGLTETAAGEMCSTYYKKQRAGADAGTEAQRGFSMLDCDVGLARPPTILE